MRHATPRPAGDCIICGTATDSMPLCDLHHFYLMDHDYDTWIDNSTIATQQREAAFAWIADFERGHHAQA